MPKPLRQPVDDGRSYAGNGAKEYTEQALPDGHAPAAHAIPCAAEHFAVGNAAGDTHRLTAHGQVHQLGQGEQTDGGRDQGEAVEQEQQSHIEPGKAGDVRSPDGPQEDSKQPGNEALQHCSPAQSGHHQHAKQAQGRHFREGNLVQYGPDEGEGGQQGKGPDDTAQGGHCIDGPKGVGALALHCQLVAFQEGDLGGARWVTQQNGGDGVQGIGQAVHCSEEG